MLKLLPIGVVRKLEERVTAQGSSSSPRHLTMVQNDELNKVPLRMEFTEINSRGIGRVRSLNGLRIVEFDCSKLTGKTPCNENAMKEIKRMRQLRPQVS
ncbi:hypothetical protein TNCV_1516871 [Trichonephila clavipes]|nr:hypothetical protein TNCV_1516871 [Trichonephila clavipes]